MPQRRRFAEQTLARAAWAALLLLATAGGARAETIDRPGRWIGRADEARQVFAWPGSGFALRFEGRRLVLRLQNQGENALVALVDGERRRIDLAPGPESYTVFDGAPGRHEIRLMKRTEGDVGTVGFLGAETDGRFLPVAAPKRHVLVIGDSISAGYGIEGAGPDCPFSPTTQDQTRTYAALTAAHFGAEATTLAASGRGLVRNYSGARSGTMRDLMDRALPGEAQPAGPASGPFDLVLVHLGTNDFSGEEEPAGFEEAYRELLEKLRQRHPQAAIYALIGPMLGPDRFAAASAAVEGAVEARRSAGDAAVRFLAFPPPPTSFGCDWHPGLVANQDMADRLIARLRTDLGW